MKIFQETVEEAANRLSEGTLFGMLFFAFLGILMVVTQHFYMSGEYWGTYLVKKGPIVVIGVGVSLIVWSFLTLWICYFRRVSRLLPHMWPQITWFWLLAGFCFIVSVSPHFIYMPLAYQIISKAGIFVLFIFAHFFHKRVKSAASQLVKQREDNQQNE
jgi:hypothetical protein